MENFEVFFFFFFLLTTLAFLFASENLFCLVKILFVWAKFIFYMEFWKYFLTHLFFSLQLLSKTGLAIFFKNKTCYDFFFSNLIFIDFSVIQTCLWDFSVKSLSFPIGKRGKETNQQLLLWSWLHPAVRSWAVLSSTEATLCLHLEKFITKKIDGEEIWLCGYGQQQQVRDLWSSGVTSTVFFGPLWILRKPRHGGWMEKY